MSAIRRRRRVPPRPRGTIQAALLCAGLVVISGIAHRAVDAHFRRFDTGVRLPAGALDRLPVAIDAWQGVDEALDGAVVELLDADQHVNRLYTKSGGYDVVGLFVSVGGRLRDLVPHRPEVCFPGAGWTLHDARQSGFQLADGTSVPCRLYRFRRGGLSGETLTVLNYYVIDGRFAADVSVLRSLAWRAHAGGAYAARVQITASSLPPQADASSSVIAFAGAATPSILAALEQAVGREVPGS